MGVWDFRVHVSALGKAREVVRLSSMFSLLCSRHHVAGHLKVIDEYSVCLRKRTPTAHTCTHLCAQGQLRQTQELSHVATTHGHVNVCTRMAGHVEMHVRHT